MPYARFVRRCAAPLCALTLCASVAPAQCPAFDGYGASWRTFTPAPIGAGSFTIAGAALHDGRLLAVTGDTVYVETATSSGVFNAGATFGLTSDPAFIAVSPDGLALAVGTGTAVVVFETSELAAQGDPAADVSATALLFGVPHYDGVWLDDTRLALSADGVVVELDVTSDPLAPSVRTLIANIDGASAGVSVDADGNLYTGNGFAFDPDGTRTGDIKAFAPALYAATPADFVHEGVLIGTVLSAVSLRFDAEGNLFVGGGDFFDSGEVGYLGVIRADAIDAALMGAGPLDIKNPAHLLRLTPVADPFAFYGAFPNHATGEIVVTYVSYDTGVATWSASVGPRPLPADIDGDNAVGFSDLVIVLSQFGSEGAGLQGDVNGDGVVDFDDLTIVLESFGDAC
ncbi:MAG: hypothetical protein EA379_10915 [Phycisphaerales bacterium]|nr:MAG: hypothetical protein EA379_10915 [Phycisphaerales bacterium]